MALMSTHVFASFSSWISCTCKKSSLVSLSSLVVLVHALASDGIEATTWLFLSVFGVSPRLGGCDVQSRLEPQHAHDTRLSSFTPSAAPRFTTIAQGVLSNKDGNQTNQIITNGTQTVTSVSHYDADMSDSDSDNVKGLFNPVRTPCRRTYPVARTIHCITCTATFFSCSFRLQ